MTDRELLELAAKAGDYTLGHGEIGGIPYYCLGGVRWNPLEDDADAFRLAVKLNLNVDLAYGDECVVRVFNETYFFKESTADDACAATRRAIVRAAAGMARYK